MGGASAPKSSGASALKGLPQQPVAHRPSQIDIACQDFKDELEAYRDFCVHRAVEAQQNGRDISTTEGAEWLEHRRKQLNLKKYLSKTKPRF